MGECCRAVGLGEVGGERLFGGRAGRLPCRQRPRRRNLCSTTGRRSTYKMNVLMGVRKRGSRSVMRSTLGMLRGVHRHKTRKTSGGAKSNTNVVLRVPRRFVLLRNVPMPRGKHCNAKLVFLPGRPGSRTSVLDVVVRRARGRKLALVRLHGIPAYPRVLKRTTLTTRPSVGRVFVAKFARARATSHGLCVVEGGVRGEVHGSSVTAGSSFCVISLSAGDVVCGNVLSSLRLHGCFPSLAGDCFADKLTLMRSHFDAGAFPA